jgi:3'-phosphoadenosine 5'-phosphosulfate sulfotransferase (PAPS reductase)/FAD synthetase
MLSQNQVIFIDTFFLFPETLDFLREVEAHYGFKAKVFHCADCATQEEFYDKYGADYWMVSRGVEPRSSARASGVGVIREGEGKGMEEGG